MKETRQRSLWKIDEFYNQKKKEIKRRLREFQNIKDEDVFYEMCFCLLTPGSNARRCDAKVKILLENNFLHTEFMPRQHIKDIRFYNNKTENLLLAKKNYNIIKKRLASVNDNYELREWLAKNIRGYGYKEASHFLRNIGRGENIAILDRHILKNLAELGVIDEVPGHISKKSYLDIEKKMLAYAKKIGIKAEELDLLLWSKETGEVFK